MADKIPVIVYSYPRSGSTWLCQMLAEYLDAPFRGLKNKHPIGAEGLNRTGDYIVYQTHEINAPAELSVVIYRDPRDISVSANHYWQIGDLAKTIKCMGEGLWPLTHFQGWRNFYNLSHNMIPIQIRYHRLLTQPIAEMALLLKTLGFPVDYRKLNKVVENQAFDQRVKLAQNKGDEMPYGKDVQLRHLRKGIAGDWKNHYNRELGQLAQKYFRLDVSWWEELGNEDWWTNLPA